MEDLKIILSHIGHSPIEFVYAFLAIFGGVARYLNSFIKGEAFSLKVFFASMLVSGFSGYMFALMGISLHLPDPLPTLMAGTGGFFGDQAMKLILEYTSGKIQ